MSEYLAKYEWDTYRIWDTARGYCVHRTCQYVGARTGWVVAISRAAARAEGVWEPAEGLRPEQVQLLKDLAVMAVMHHADRHRWGVRVLKAGHVVR